MQAVSSLFETTAVKTLRELLLEVFEDLSFSVPLGLALIDELHRLQQGRVVSWAMNMEELGAS